MNIGTYFQRQATRMFRCLKSATKAGFAGWAESPYGNKSETQTEKNDEHTLARHALRRENVSEAAGLYFDRRAHAQPGHRREHGNFQRLQCRDAAPIAVSGTRTCRECMGYVSASWRKQDRRDLCKLRGFEGTHARCLRAAGAVSGGFQYDVQLDRWQCAGTYPRRARDWRFLSRARR